MFERETALTRLQDLTELQALRIALAEKQAQLTAALEAARMATWRRDLQTGRTTTSESMGAIWGLLPEQTFEADAQAYQLLHPDDRESHRAVVQQALAAGTGWHAEYRAMRPRDGRIAWLEERGQIQTDQLSGHPVLDGLICDITQRKLAEAVLRESEARKTFLLHLNDVLHPLADPIRIQFEAARVLGKHLGADRAYYSSPEGQSPLSDVTETRVDPRSPYCITDTGVSHALSAGTRAAYQALGIRAFASVPVIKEGTLVWTLNVVSSTARDWTADEIALIKEVAERTWAAVERARAEAALRASEQRFREFAAASTDILWIRNARTLQFEFVSSAFSKVYGALVEEAFGGGNELRGWMRLIKREDRHPVFEALRQVRAGEQVMYEFRIVRPPDGQVRWIRTTSFPLLAADNTVGHIGGISQDCTAEKEAANRLQLLVTELQHRTRNQIAVVRSLSDRTLDESGSLAEYRLRYGQRLSALARVQRLLSHLSEGQRITFDELLRSELAAHGAAPARVFLEGPTGVRLRSSTVQTLALALHELATNAVKYGAISVPGGQLRVGWHVTGNDDGTNLRLNVEWRETGVNIAADDLALQHRGYGRELIERALPYQLNAKTHYEIGPAGVRCIIDVPISGVLPARER